jgi:glutathione synthase
MERLHENTDRLALEAREMALARGLLKYTPEGRLSHLPFTLHPWTAPRSFLEGLYHLAPLFNRLYAAVTNDWDFLRAQLEPAARVDDFVQNMLASLPRQYVPKPQLFLSRNDFLPTGPDLAPRQVEINLIAAALGPSSQRVNEMHRVLYHESDLADRILPTAPGRLQVDLLARAWSLYGDPAARILFLVPDDETNIFEQVGMASSLTLEHGVPVLRCTLEELGREGQLREGDLWFRGRRVALAYFRVGYVPAHYRRPEAWRARRLLEESSAISVPSIAAQLANFKKIQQRLGVPGVLRRFLADDEARALETTFATMAHPLEKVSWQGREAPARELALAWPDGWVLKPQREGGRNNLFGRQMVEQLGRLSPAEAEAWVLMEFLRPVPFPCRRLVDGRIHNDPCVCEVGIYGGWLAAGDGLGEPLVNSVLGYLVRTKEHTVLEAGVVGGFASLDSIAVPPPESAADFPAAVDWAE